jgi:hypothetical protein
LSDDGLSAVVTRYDGDEVDVVIASSYKGRPVREISAGAFARDYHLQSVTIPDSVTAIESGAFSNCLELSKVVLGNGVTYVGEKAFLNSENITDLTGPLPAVYWVSHRKVETLTISSGATLEGLNGFVNLKTVFIPDSIVSIHDNAFAACRNITNIMVGSRNRYYKSVDGNLYTKDGYGFLQYALGKEETTFTVPDGVTRIGTYAFTRANLTSIVLPDSIGRIDNEAFYDCRNLASVTLPEGLTSIGFGAFMECRNLTSIIIPDSVTTIESAAFAWCENLTSVFIPDSVKFIGDGVFILSEKLTIYCEAESAPNTWDEEWNSWEYPVIWGYTGE